MRKTTWTSQDFPSHGSRVTVKGMRQCTSKKKFEVFGHVTDIHFDLFVFVVFYFWGQRWLVVWAAPRWLVVRAVPWLIGVHKCGAAAAWPRCNTALNVLCRVRVTGSTFTDTFRHTHSKVLTPFVCLACSIYACAMTRSYMWRDSPVRNTVCNDSKRTTLHTNTQSGGGATMRWLGSLHDQVSLANKPYTNRALFTRDLTM